MTDTCSPFDIEEAKIESPYTTNSSNPLGFYNVADEIQKVEHTKFPTTVDEIEGEKRCDKEARLRRQDAARNSILHRQDAPSAVLQVNKLNDPEAAVRKRPKLNLPTSQIPDHELEHIAKFRLPDFSEEFPGGSLATRALLVDYAHTPHQVETSLRSPLRTPASKHDAIMVEAENQARPRLSQTPLPGENPESHPSDFSGVTPKKIENQTPNFSGLAALTSRVGFTPSRDGASFGMNPKGTPIRDDLHINDDLDIHGSAKLELRRQVDLKQNLRFGLTSLPQPKNEDQIMVQPAPEENEDPQRELHRPPVASLDLLKSSLLKAEECKSSLVPPTLIEQADEMLRKELLSLLEHDSLKYPINGKVQKEKKNVRKGTAMGNTTAVPLIDQFEEDELKEADYHIMKECIAMGHESESFDDFVEARRNSLNDMMYFPTRSSYGLSSVAGNMEKVTAMQYEFELVRRRLDDDTKKAQRIEQKIKLLTNGYQNRGKNLWSQMVIKLMDNAGTDLKCFQALCQKEQLAESHGVDTLREEVQKQKELEQTLQKCYGYLLLEQERIQNLMNEFSAEKKVKRMQESSVHFLLSEGETTCCSLTEANERQNSPQLAAFYICN
ncbi:Pre-mRNA-splicing factor CDC5/CEF1 [Heracleum sosnowskyi]|uniref:Pre-mRNA-splicing factor CDC5/CEF1 n=1 Tax=Heracleum sosnowskyi TaxID=360622 RepID=A0AAD8JCT7_9APIA|nr:Pre-mRNA-splicing factor CDC5/CEF1 [Heracleum sosnowskyi]